MRDLSRLIVALVIAGVAAVTVMGRSLAQPRNAPPPATLHSLHISSDAVEPPNSGLRGIVFEVDARYRPPWSTIRAIPAGEPVAARWEGPWSPSGLGQPPFYTHTREDGSFTLSNMPPGHYDVHLYAATDWVGGLGTVTLEQERITDATFVAPPGPVLSGRVVDADGSTPVPHAIVELSRPVRTPEQIEHRYETLDGRAAVTDADGRFRILGDCSGEWMPSVTSRQPGTRIPLPAVKIRAPHHRTLALVLPPLPEVTMRLVDKGVTL